MGYIIGSGYFAALAGRVWKGKSHNGAHLPLDMVDSSLIGALKIPALQELIQTKIPHFQDLPWITQLFTILLATSEVDWCGWDGTGCGDSEGPHARTDSMFADQFAQVCKHTTNGSKSLFRRITKVMVDNRFFHRFFTVPKGDGLLARLITSCKVLNKRVARCRLLRFGTIEDLFRILLFFGAPACAVSDFRHWFFQIPLPENCKKLFSVHSGDVVGEMLAWPMGFSWSPFIAQCIGMAFMAIAITTAGFTPSYPDFLSQDEVPPFWIIKNEVGAIVAFAMIWYDNIIIAASNAPIRDTICRAMRSIAKIINAAWKPQKEQDRNPRDLSDPFLRSTSEVAYTGIHFSMENGSIRWKHLDSNRTRWSTSLATKLSSFGLPKKTLIWRDVSEIIGVIIWDWWVSGTSRSSILPTLEIATRIGMSCESNRDWDCLAQLSPMEWDALILAFQTIAADNSWKHRTFPQEIQSRNIHDNLTLATSDAMKLRGAGVIFSLAGKEINFAIFTWSNEEYPKSINWKETSSGIRTINWILDTYPHVREILIGVDNTTAWIALTKWVFTTNPITQLELDTLCSRLQRLGVSLFVHQIPGTTIVADDRSRGAISIPSKMLACAKLLLTPRDGAWWQIIKRRARA